MADKQAWRRRAGDLAPATDDESRAVVARLATLPAVTGATRVCLFLPMPGEVDLRALPAVLPDASWVTTRTGAGPALTVHDLDAPLERHPFGYDQPRVDAPVHDPASVDAWLVPGLAFDHDGTRLGHGVGYYDRLLARRGPEATTIAVTLERRVVASLPREDHDVAMDLVVTEQRVLSRPGPASRGTAR